MWVVELVGTTINYVSFYYFLCHSRAGPNDQAGLDWAVDFTNLPLNPDFKAFVCNGVTNQMVASFLFFLSLPPPTSSGREHIIGRL